MYYNWETFFILLLRSWMAVGDWSGHCETDPESSVHGPQSPEPVNLGPYTSPHFTIVWAIIKEAVLIYT